MSDKKLMGWWLGLFLGAFMLLLPGMYLGGVWKATLGPPGLTLLIMWALLVLFAHNSECEAAARASRMCSLGV